ncbi:MAG: MBOAT family protein [Thalassobaculales bacterium]
MLFPTLDFAIFFLLVFPLAWMLAGRPLPHRLLLVAASYLFYGFWDWRFCFLLLAMSLFAWAAGLALAGGRKPLLLAGAIGVLLLVLGFFKYYGFFVEQALPLLAALGWERDIALIAVALPVGISFLTFHGISYLVDVHRGDLAPARQPLDVMLYLSFFPHLVAGPIVRAGAFLPQLARPPDMGVLRRGEGLLLILVGVFKKVFVASTLGVELVDPVFLDPAGHGRADLVLAALGYAAQIYCDFSAYSDMAVGLAGLLGYRFPRNFERPYAATSIRDFWRRWHVTLSAFLRDYLYKPLGGSRHGTLATTANLMVVMTLGGLWHGAAWSFIAWGALHGAALALERALRGTREGGVAGWCATFTVVTAGWVLFRAGSGEAALDYAAALARGEATSALATPLHLALIGGTIAVQFVPEAPRARLIGWFGHLSAAERGLAAGLWLAAVGALAPDGILPFIYFQF